jgi:hypothetical protein
VPPFAVWRDTMLAVLVVSAIPVVTVAALAWDAERVRRLVPPTVAWRRAPSPGGAVQLVPKGTTPPRRAAGRGGGSRLVAAGAAAFRVVEWMLHGSHGTTRRAATRTAGPRPPGAPRGAARRSPRSP